ncbi:MAG: hypothetical protein ACAI34_04065 [Verrucomicrobium sp.]
MKQLSRTLAGMLLLAFLCPVHAAEEDEILFGSKEKDAAGLIAIIYDLKQTQSRQPSNVSAGEYPDVVKEFLQKGWDELVLNRFFRITRPLYSTQIFIPRISADVAPKAYGVDNVMRPSAWVIHYKGQVSPPEDGTYRFAGYADDVLAVAVNNKTVCIGARPDMEMKSLWKSTENEGADAFNGNLMYGDWIPMKKGEPIDLDVLVGERPGGDFCAFLLFQKQGVDYPKDRSGKLILPVFQLAPQNIPGKDDGKSPPFQKSGLLWKQHR